MGEMGNNFRLDEQYLAVGGLAQDILQIIREHYTNSWMVSDLSSWKLLELMDT